MLRRIREFAGGLRRSPENRRSVVHPSNISDRRPACMWVGDTFSDPFWRRSPPDLRGNPHWRRDLVAESHYGLNRQTGVRHRAQFGASTWKKSWFAVSASPPRCCSSPLPAGRKTINRPRPRKKRAAATPIAFAETHFPTNFVWRHACRNIATG